MSSRHGLRARGVAVAAALLGLSAPAAAIDVFLRSPAPFAPVFGEVVLEAEVLSAAAVASVEFRVDGERVAELRQPPWTSSVDVGDENREHVIEVLATDVQGETATARTVTPAIAIDSELDLGLQQLYVTVTRAGSRALDLSAEAFSVVDQGRRQELVTFERGDVPLTVVLLVDASLSMAGEPLAAAVEGASELVARMHPLDEAKLLLFSDHLLHETPFTADPGLVAASLGAVAARGGTAVNDHLYLALGRLERHQGRRVVILLSDGGDVESVLGIDDVRWKAERSQAAIYWIRLDEDDGRRVLARTSAWRDPEEHRHEREGLARLVARSGGRVVGLARIGDAAAAFGEILAELREQYVLGYYPAVDRDDGSWHPVRVEVAGAGHRVRTREGYVDD